MSDYLESDFPWTLYFQGVPMPKWSNCWHWQPIEDSKVDWHLDQVYGRMDHTGCLESEDSEVFIIAAQQTLLAMIDHRDLFAPFPEVTPEANEIIYEHLMSGLQRMILKAEETEVVFWTSGYEADGQMVRDAVDRFLLGPETPNFQEPPHRVRRRNEKISDLNWQRKEMRRRLEAIGPNKDLKRFIHDLKDKKC